VRHNAHVESPRHSAASRVSLRRHDETPRHGGHPRVHAPQGERLRPERHHRHEVRQPPHRPDGVGRNDHARLPERGRPAAPGRDARPSAVADTLPVRGTRGGPSSSWAGPVRGQVLRTAPACHRGKRVTTPGVVTARWPQARSAGTSSCPGGGVRPDAVRHDGRRVGHFRGRRRTGGSKRPAARIMR